MKKFFILPLCVLLVLSFSCCTGEKTSESEPTAVNSQEEIETGIIPNDVDENSEEAINVKATVANYLDTFISCDFDAIKAILHEDDTWFFNFESEDQLAFYEAIFPRIEYKFDYVSEHKGVYGVMTEITSPDMAEVYGTIITDYIDSTTGANNKTHAEILNESTEKMLELIKSPDIKKRVSSLYVYVEYIDGNYIPRCDPYLANELTGGAPETSDEIQSSLNEAINALSE